MTSDESKLPREMSYSQFGEDLVFRKLLDGFKSRYIVDVGANDGHSWSNSHLLGQLGFSLLLIEPMPDYAERCRTLYADRTDVSVEAVAIGRHPGEAAFFVHTHKRGDPLAMRSSLHKAFLPTREREEIRVPVKRLDDVLAVHHWPEDYALLTIDTEGQDLETLQTAGLDRYRPYIICVVEAEAFADRIQALMLQHRYRRLLQCGSNVIYLKEGAQSVILS